LWVHGCKLKTNFILSQEIVLHLVFIWDEFFFIFLKQFIIAYGIVFLYLEKEETIWWMYFVFLIWRYLDWKIYDLVIHGCKVKIILYWARDSTPPCIYLRWILLRYLFKKKIIAYGIVCLYLKKKSRKLFI